MDQVTPLVEIGFGTLPLIATLIIHGIGMYLVQRAFEAHGIRICRAGRHEQLFFAGMIVLMLATHLIEIFLWSAAVVGVEAIPGFRDAFYYVAGTYTTLGYGEGTLPKAWRLLAPMIAISGLFAFGWTTGVLLTVMSRASQARAEGIAARSSVATSQSTDTSMTRP